MSGWNINTWYGVLCFLCSPRPVAKGAPSKEELAPTGTFIKNKNLTQPFLKPTA